MIVVLGIAVMVGASLMPFTVSVKLLDDSSPIASTAVIVIRAVPFWLTAGVIVTVQAPRVSQTTCEASIGHQEGDHSMIRKQ
jgi:hypothetical protein